jgi:anti-sigma factor RsiW
MKVKVTCRDGVAALMSYLEGLLTPTRHAALEAHVAGCRRCTAFVNGYRAMPRIVRAATSVELTKDAAAALRRFLSERI